jgi:hypothetical protein
MLALIDNTVTLKLYSSRRNSTAVSVNWQGRSTCRRSYGRIHERRRLKSFAPPTDLTCLSHLTLNAIESELRLGLRSQLGLGEAACIAVAYIRRGLSFSSNRAVGSHVMSSLCDVLHQPHRVYLRFIQVLLGGAFRYILRKAPPIHRDLTLLL